MEIKLTFKQLRELFLIGKLEGRVLIKELEEGHIFLDGKIKIIIED